MQRTNGENFKKNRSGAYLTFLRVFACFTAFLMLVLIVMESSTLISDAVWSPWSPDYAFVDLSPALEKAQSERTEEDYALIYAQTGLTKIGADRLLESGENGKNRIKTIKKSYMQKISFERNRFNPWTCEEKLSDGNSSEIGAVREGDIIVTSATHVFGFRYGHAALVVSDSDFNPNSGLIVEAYSPGTVSVISNIASSFDRYATFMILRPNPEKIGDETRKEAANYAKTQLLGIPYTVFAGIFGKKNQQPLKGTQCAHIVWYAYKQFGVDLDANGGCVVKPRDMANSEYMQVVQVFGFDPEKVWT